MRYYPVARLQAAGDNGLAVALRLNLNRALDVFALIRHIDGVAVFAMYHRRERHYDSRSSGGQLNVDVGIHAVLQQPGAVVYLGAQVDGTRRLVERGSDVQYPARKLVRRECSYADPDGQPL